MKDIPLDWLETLVAFAQERNVQSAAEARGLTQPAVTQQLQKLESKMAQPIFENQGRRKILTSFGEAIAAQAQQHLLALRRDLEHTALVHSNPENSTIRFGGRREILTKIVPHIRYPGRLVATNMSTTEVVRSLEAREIDVGVTYVLPDSADFIAKPLFTDHARLCAHSDLLGGGDALKRLASVDFVRETPALLYREVTPYVDSWLMHLGIERTEIHPRLICDDWTTLVHLVEAKQGWSIVPSTFAPGPNTVTLEIPRSVIPESQFYVLYAARLKSAPGFQAFMNSLATVSRELFTPGS